MSLEDFLFSDTDIHHTTTNDDGVINFDDFISNLSCLDQEDDITIAVRQELEKKIAEDVTSETSPNSVVEDPVKEPRHYFKYDSILSPVENIKNATRFHRYERQGFGFVAHRHRLAVDEFSEHVAASLFTKCMRTGNNHFVTGEIVYDSNKRKWLQGRVKDDGDDIANEINSLKFDGPPPKKVRKITAIVNTIDKIKVMTGPYNDTLMAKTNAINSLEGVETHEPKPDGMGGTKHKITSAFLLHKNKFGPVPSTRVTYKPADYTANPNAHTVTEKPNNSNINGTRGTHEFILVNRINEAHSVCNNPYGDIHTSLVRECENNNSLTVDSAINSTVNMSFKAKACKKTDQHENESGSFILIQKAEYGTHKTTIVPDSHKREDVENEPVKEAGVDEERRIILQALNSREVQVHAHCINCSALGGYQIIGAIKEIAAKIFADPNILTSLAASNAKGVLMCSSHSLVWSQINTFIDVCCWKYRLHQYPLERQMEFYLKVLLPILQKMFVSRYNFAQAGIFCHSVVKPTTLFNLHDYRLVTPKFKSYRTAHLFAKAETINDQAMDMNKKWNNKRPLAMSKNSTNSTQQSTSVDLSNRNVDKNKSSFSNFTTQPARGQSIPDFWYHGASRSRNQIAQSLGGPVGNER